MKTLLVVLSLLTTLNFGYADNSQINHWYQELKDSEITFHSHGAVCEQIAKIQMADQYPPDEYEITTGIIYGKAGIIIGELDLVVFDKTHEARMVAEVKCKRRVAAARKEAQLQLERFYNKVVDSDLPIVFYGADGEDYDVRQFDEIEKEDLKTISQLEGEPYFEYTVGLNYDEVILLWKRLKRCQTSKHC